ncbi:MAG TPA: metalloregulator ArsR/SmtB family transcription factor [Rhizomicrobium sp.]|nr:metalloregulator ArsR/SmtB family transcription factor [Rhizomicrobium sp.]
MAEPLLDFFKAMADESRLRIVGLLASRERSVQELARALDLKEPTVSHHLAILKALGLVTARAEGTKRWHALDKEALERLARGVLKPLRDTKKAETFDAKVLQSFVSADGTLKSIPASRKKRTFVLRWLMRDFAAARRYREVEVNAAIQAHHWDSATLRRELVGHRMLARKDRVYWRLPESEWQDGGAA